jgi:hypothetical protein
MVVVNVRQLAQAGALLLSIVSMVGCPQLTSSQTFDSTQENELSEENTLAQDLQTLTTAVAATASPVTYTICSDRANWQRPSLQEQEKQLGTDPRYADALQVDPLKRLSQDFWRHEVLSFTTYGLSARMEPINLSGLWSVADQIWEDCYGGDAPEQINAGALAEAWLMNYRLVDLQWQDGQYTLVVEPASAGVQVVQFERVEHNAELPLMVVQANGQVVEVLSADW